MEVVEKVLNGLRITEEDALYLLEHTSLLLLGHLANLVRRRLHPEEEVTFVIDRNINYTNVCICRCRFCAFCRSPSDEDAYLLDFSTLKRKIEETLELGGTAILLQGGLHPHLDIGYYEELLTFIKSEFPQLHIHGFSAPELVHISRVSGISVEETIRRLKSAGLGSIPGGGAEILVDSVRRAISPRKISTKEWLDVHRTAHRLGVRTTATMMFGSVDTWEDVVEHLAKVTKVNGKDRDGFCITVLKRSGGAENFTGKWALKEEDSGFDSPVLTVMKELQSAVLHGALSRRFAFHLRAVLRDLGGVDEALPNALAWQFERQKSRKVKKLPFDASKVAQTLVDAARGYGGDKALAERVLDLVMVTEFLSREGRA
jgi:cyclic dehypoxanthinyl futalosine synthase